MRAMMLQAPAPIATAPLHLVDIAPPLPAEGEILVEISHCGVCRTDLHIVEGEVRGPLPLIPGHQIVGEVSLSRSDRFQKGERVGIAWLGKTCGSCSFCAQARENLCPHARYTGLHAQGGYAEYVTADAAYAYPLAPCFESAEAAPLLCAGIVGYRAYAECALPTEGRLGIYGFGASAHLILQVALYQGHEVFVSTRNPRHQELAREMGASWAGEGALPRLVESALVFAPSGQVVGQALRDLVPGGTAVLAGIAMSPIPELEYEPHLFHEKHLRSIQANTRKDGEAFLALAAEIPLHPHITLYPLEKANEALLDLKEGRLLGSAVITVL